MNAQPDLATDLRKIPTFWKVLIGIVIIGLLGFQVFVIIPEKLQEQKQSQYRSFYSWYYLSNSAKVIDVETVVDEKWRTSFRTTISYVSPIQLIEIITTLPDTTFVKAEWETITILFNEKDPYQAVTLEEYQEKTGNKGRIYWMVN